MHSRQYISNVEGPPKFCIDLEADWLLILGEVGGKSPGKVFLLFFLLPDWLKLNHLKSRMECGFSDIFSHHFCSTTAETIGLGLTINPASFGTKKCSENHI